MILKIMKFIINLPQLLGVVLFEVKNQLISL